MKSVSRWASVSIRHLASWRTLREQLAQLVQPADLDLAGTLGRQAETLADLIQRLRGLAQPVVGPNHRPLASIEPVGKITHLADLDLVEDPVIRLFGDGIT